MNTLLELKDHIKYIEVISYFTNATHITLVEDEKAMSVRG